MATDEGLRDLPKVLNEINAKCGSVKDLPLSDFVEYINVENYRTKKIKDEPKIKELRSAGVYLIYEDNKVIYVGSAGKKHTLRNRIGDLFTYRPNNVQSKGTNHNLTYKLMHKERYKRFDSIEEVRQFYFRCRFKFIQTEGDAEAHAVESTLIMLLTPKYNNESAVS